MLIEWWKKTGNLVRGLESFHTLLNVISRTYTNSCNKVIYGFIVAHMTCHQTRPWRYSKSEQSSSKSKPVYEWNKLTGKEVDKRPRTLSKYVLSASSNIITTSKEIKFWICQRPSMSSAIKCTYDPIAIQCGLNITLTWQIGTITHGAVMYHYNRGIVCFWIV